MSENTELNEVVTNNQSYSTTKKNNHLMLGFVSWHELLNKIMGIKQSVFNLIVASITGLTTFINNYVWDDAKAIYFMLFLISVDAITGISKAIKHKTFSSARLPRILVIMVIYTTLLAISWNVSKFSKLYEFLPGVLYGGFIATLMISIFENLHELELIPDRIYTVVKSKLDALQNSILGDEKKKATRRKKK